MVRLKQDEVNWLAALVDERIKAMETRVARGVGEGIRTLVARTAHSPTVQYATVTAVDGLMVTATLDTDGVDVVANALTSPNIGDRVAVQMVPPSSALILGVLGAASGGGGAQGIPAVADVTAIPIGSRYVGEIVYQTGTSSVGGPGTYQLLGGTADLNWTLFGVTYTPPTVTLTTNRPASNVLNVDSYASIILTAHVTKGSAAVVQVRFKRAGTLIDTINHNDNLSSYTDPYTDNTTLATTTTFTVEVDDSTGQTTTASATITFVDTAPTVTLTLTSGNGSPYEKTQATVSPAFSCTATKKSHPITSVVLQKSTDGGANWTNVHTFSALAPNGGTDTFTDTGGVTDQTSYRAQATDGVNAAVNSAQTTFTYHFPQFWGVGAAGLNAAGIAALANKTLARTNTAAQAEITSPSAQRVYMAHPNSWTAYTHAKDPNFANTDYIGQFTQRTDVTIDGVVYRVYEIDHDVTLTNWELDWS